MRANGKGLPPPSTPIPDITKWTPNDYTEAVSATAKLAEMTDKAGGSFRHPWRGVLNLDLQPNDLQRLEGKLGEAANKLSAFVDLLNNAATARRCRGSSGPSRSYQTNWIDRNPVALSASSSRSCCNRSRPCPHPIGCARRGS